MQQSKDQISFQVYDCPGKKLLPSELSNLHQELLEIGKTCFDEIPDYQCLSGKKFEFDRLIISVARNHSGKMIGFCSSYIFDEDRLGKILHLGLTCVSPEARGLKLTHLLTSKVVRHFLLKYSLFKSSWVTNVACVLSSLGNVATYFDEVYPSPDLEIPSGEQSQIAKIIDKKYRREIYISGEAKFNPDTFVFEGSVAGNMFQKDGFDKRYLHRNEELNHYFRSRMMFERGDEILQVGKVSLLTYPLYFLRKVKTRIFMSRPKLMGEAV